MIEFDYSKVKQVRDDLGCSIQEAKKQVEKEQLNQELFCIREGLYGDLSDTERKLFDIVEFLVKKQYPDNWWSY